MASSADFTFSEGYLGLLSMLGALLGIIYCCMPSLGPVVWKAGEVWSQTGMRLVDYGTMAQRRSGVMSTIWPGGRH